MDKTTQPTKIKSLYFQRSNGEYVLLLERCTEDDKSEIPTHGPLENVVHVLRD